ncbi:MAG: hypothetical protein H0U79_00585 [Solirubrobacterales bacterium]|nr:hypothetical protein [Solirubrobacterales bacterium]
MATARPQDSDRAHSSDPTSRLGPLQRARALTSEDRVEADRRARARTNRRATADLARTVRTLMREEPPRPTLL